MTSRLRVWMIAGVTCLAIGLLWWLTAGEDSEALLWRRYPEWVVDVNVVATVLLAAAGYIFLLPGSARHRASDVLAVGASAAVILVLGEVPALFFHLDYGQAFGVRANNASWQLAVGLNRADEELISLHQPHKRYTGTMRGNLAILGIPKPALHDYDVAYDKNGFRNDEDYTRADVALIGDSMVEAAEVPPASAPDRQLGRLLGMTVVNLGQSGYGPQQELVVLRRYGVPLSPKVVVWFFCVDNDLANATVYESMRRAPDAAMPTWSSRSFVRNLILAVARRTTPQRTSPSLAARRWQAEFTRADGTIETTYLNPNDRSWEPQGWDLTTAALLAARDETRAIGATFVVVYVPRKLHVYRDYVRPAVPEGWSRQPDHAADVMRKWCAQQAVECLDATVPLRERVAQGESTHLPDDSHWNTAGHRAVATALAERLKPFLSGRSATGGQP